jgi:hypothetical protein
VKAYSKPGELLALRHAMKNYLSRDLGLAAVIRAVVDGSLVSVGYTNRFRWITGYLFVSEDLRNYGPVARQPSIARVHPAGRPLSPGIDCSRTLPCFQVALTPL